ncbi:hypothetical protein CXT14_23505 [Salmonella enterica]|nr:hypothetical protein [Salmonella enterica]HBC0233092.1 hypothetical protein [Salmonella enterica subsp. enterica serovar Napoli]HBL9704562.1 hypothetical protein [Salmonella enterica subsp. enterica serovar Livingstone]EBH1716604.1 hypothetical protein [Salmonella enterica]EBI1908730.1 hypothetical protein [Salmonella enterica]
MINVFLIAATLTSAGYFTNHRIIEPQPFRSMSECKAVLQDIQNRPELKALMPDSQDRAGCFEIRPGDTLESAFDRGE